MIQKYNEQVKQKLRHLVKMEKKKEVRKRDML